MLNRAADLGIKYLQLETELSYNVTLNPKLVEELVAKQKKLIEQYHDKFGIRLALRVTVADIRNLKSITYEEAWNKMLEAFEASATAGADLLSIESIGGKEVHDHALIRNDIEGVVFSLGVLAVRDMVKLWREIATIAKKHGSLPAGDTACGFANTAMKLAGGRTSRLIPHVLAAVVRAMSAARSLVAYEEGATGPGKDCGYENVIVKAVTGLPMAMEGKTSASAHSSLVGNIAAAVCDLWSNEQVENLKLFGGTTPQVFLEMLYYDTELMNTALKKGKEKELRDLLVESDKYRDPQAYVLAPDVAWQIALTIAEHREKRYLRTVEAGITAARLISSEEKLWKDPAETRQLKRILQELEKLPKDEDDIIDKAVAKYRDKIPAFKPERYSL